ncbi:MAG: mevalonate kinase [Promethearchaeota archaeon]|nr:MAG: mevalonate kinase [Candidatus Lokiarchaeota archaeon]
MKSITIISPGKSILFGEHAVVYGYPAIAMAISIKSYCQIERSDKGKIIIHLKNYGTFFEAPNIKILKSKIPSAYQQFCSGLQNFKDSFNIQLNNLLITLESDLFPGAGLGSSASISVAFIYGLNHFFNLNLSKDEVNQLAFQMEKEVHGLPSGVDNTTCTYGNAIFFQEGNFKFIDIKKDIPILITYTNTEHNTKQAIGRIRDLKRINPKKIEKIFEKIGELTNQAEKELTKGNTRKIGELMNQNQKCLTELQISNREINEIVQTATENGALGSKLTGAGLGGCVISIGEKEILEGIALKLNKKGYESFVAKSDTQGVRINEYEE